MQEMGFGDHVRGGLVRTGSTCADRRDHHIASTIDRRRITIYGQREVEKDHIAAAARGGAAPR
jgi:hypothetical protein